MGCINVFYSISIKQNINTPEYQQILSITHLLQTYLPMLVAPQMISEFCGSAQRTVSKTNKKCVKVYVDLLQTI